MTDLGDAWMHPDDYRALLDALLKRGRITEEEHAAKVRELDKALADSQNPEDS